MGALAKNANDRLGRDRAEGLDEREQGGGRLGEDSRVRGDGCEVGREGKPVLRGGVETVV